ncbi:hypothetical protein GDO86_002522 [Hymenochirus boettgeri]|uniref:UmuC domain-containing protein n=1 Tax=Hymenochirus boettgeri TaxID=247094 RepID=A0A8T2KIG2_9PIPI|nr:hypothetical protein GDO86_002522 [Hymenochirus boettgeri]
MEEEEDWMCPGDSPRALGRSGGAVNKVIVHIDMDCFYAQVEMIRNPDLKNKPLGVQQKYIVVTCNYEARKFGVNKLMSIREAKEKCPQLVLVSGEDLTPYREMSYKATELLEEFSPKVERLGFDENFIDVTELVDKKLQKMPWSDRNPESLVSGHVYNEQKVDVNDWAHTRISVGSRVAAEIRASLYNKLGLTGCAGVASNKLLAKLVSGTHKPNQQTILLPESHSHMINSLDHVKRIPGIGYKTTKRLESLGLSRVNDLQTCPYMILEKEFGGSIAQRIQMLSRGEDDSPVTPSGPPQSISDEDSFKKCSTVTEVKTKMEELLKNLLIRQYKDGRIPHTLRLTIRQFSPTNKWFNRESRQCPVPSHINWTVGAESEAVPALMGLLMRLFEKMINVKTPFHLTLLNVCFCNLKASNPTRRSIGFYLTQKAMPGPNQQDGLMETEKNTRHDFRLKDNSSQQSNNQPASPGSVKKYSELPLVRLPEGIDMEVFQQLPEDIKQEILMSPVVPTAPRREPNSQALPSKGILNFFSKSKADDHSKHGGDCSLEKSMASFMGVTKVHHFTVSDCSDSVSYSTCKETQSPSCKRPLNGHLFTKAKIDIPSTCSHEDNSVLDNKYSLAPLTKPRSSHVCEGTDDIDSCSVTKLTNRCRCDKGDSMNSNVSPSTSHCTVHGSVQSPHVDMESQVNKGGDQEVSFPNSVDMNVFFQLPEEVKRELMAEWRQLDHKSKIPGKKQMEKAKSFQARKTKTPTGPNSLLKYFKPN